MTKSILIIALMAWSFASKAQGDYLLQKRGNVTVSWRLVSDFQRDNATCWGWTYHIFISNANTYPVKLKDNEVYQNKGDYSACWQSGSLTLLDEMIPAGKWKEYTFRVISSKGGQPGSPGLKYNIDWYNRQ
jgi:hypothetical protein